MPALSGTRTIPRILSPVLPLTAVAAPVALFVFALAVRAWAAAPVDFPPSEPSAYYVGVARNLLEGRGLVSDAAWAYPVDLPIVPRPAFEQWMPLPTFLAALPMLLLGHTFPAAQLSSVVVGSVVAPLGWLMARDAARARGLSAERVATVAIGGGLAAAVMPTLLVADMTPESTTAFTSLALICLVLMPAAVGNAMAAGPDAGSEGAEAGAALADAGAAVPSHRRALAVPADRRALALRLALGVCLGLAYLARQEAAYLGLAYLLLVLSRRAPLSARLAVLAPTVLAGGLTVLPWLLRNLSVLGQATPTTLELALLQRNEQLFAWAHRPTLEAFLAQGPEGIVGFQLAALARNAADVVLFPTAPLGLIGLLALAAVALRRLPGALRPLPLRLALLTGGATFLVTSLVFPVASAWGTFRHAAGPVAVALGVLAVLGLDAAVAGLAQLRHWPRSNAWLAPLAAVAMATPLALLQVGLFAAQAGALEDRFARIVPAVEALPQLADAPRAGDPPAPRVAALSDHPIWMAEALGRPVGALPDEPPSDVWRLARALSARIVVVIDQRGRYPAAFDGVDEACFQPLRIRDQTIDDVRILAVGPGPCPPGSPQ
jgi:hypothetical protein